MSTPHDLILAVDTSGAGAGLVLARGGRSASALLALRDGGFARTEDLASAAARLLEDEGLSPRGLTLVGAVVGPGSYTGLRSGLAFVRGLAFADALPAVAVGTLELLAWRGASEGETVAVVWPAAPGRSMTAVYRLGDGIVHEVAAPAARDDDECRRFLGGRPEGLSAVVVPAPAADWLAGAAGAAGLAIRVPDGDALSALALLVAARARAGLVVRAAGLLPVYVGQSSAQPNQNRVAVAGAPQ